MTEPDPSPQAIDLRVSVTDRCQLRCAYCRPVGRIDRLPREEILHSAEVLRMAGIVQRRFGLAKLRLTGGDPLLRRGIVDLVSSLACLSVPDLALTTNGQLLTDLAAPLKRAGLGRINVSIDSLRPEVFAAVTRGGSLPRTLAGIAAAQAAGLHPIKTNTVVMRGVNDGEIADLAAFALEGGWESRFIELMPTGLQPGRFEEWFVPADEILGLLARRFSLAPLPYAPGSSSRRFRITGASGRAGIVGIISPTTRPFCGNCRRLRLTADGRIIGCLGRSEAIPIRAFLRADASEEEIVAAVAACLSRKRTISFKPPAVMSAVGG